MTALRVMALRVMALRVMALRVMALRVMALRVMALRVMALRASSGRVTPRASSRARACRGPEPFGARASLLLLGAALGVGGCQSGEPPTQIDIEGKSYVAVDPAADGTMITSEETAVTPVLAESTPLTSRTREALALGLRPAVLHPSGQLFLAEEPNWQAADAILDGVEGPTETRSPSGAPRGDGTGGIGAAQAPLILGSKDDRNTVLDTSIVPRNAITRADPCPRYRRRGAPGMSGAPWYFEVPFPINDYIDWRVAGTDIGFRVIDDPARCNPTRRPCVVNVARRIDDTYDHFIRTVSFDF